MLSGLTRKVREGCHLQRREAAQALEAILSPKTADVEIATFLTALHQKGETSEELAGFAETMRRHAVSVRCRDSVLVDTAGTGGGTETFNISTTSAFVIAGAGLRVAKHGNRAVTSKSGSADVLTALGINIEAPRELAESALDEVGIAFFFAPLFHPSMKRVALIRRNLSHRTIFNLLGPLTNPAGAGFQVIGVYAPELTSLVGAALSSLGCKRAWVVHSRDGMDEISSGSPSHVTEVGEGTPRDFEFRPADWGFEPVPVDRYTAGTAAHNAELSSGILKGEISGPCREVVVINAAAALHVATGVEFAAAVRQAEESIDSGAAWEKLVLLRRHHER